MRKINSEILVKQTKKLDSVQKALVNKFKQAQKNDILYEEIKQKALEHNKSNQRC